MLTIWIIFRREVAQYFASPLAYLIAAAFLLLTGITFNNDVALSITVKPVEPALIPDLLAEIMVLIAPLLTMRLLAEEHREGTVELLLTAPIADSSIVIGKFLSAWAYFTFLLALTLLYQFILVNISQPDIAHTIAAYLGIWLYGGATLAVGLLFSATTENQILAAFLSLITLLVLYFGDSAGQIVANLDVAAILFNLTLRGHYAPSFSIGVVRAEDVVYYAGVMAVALFIAIRLLESKRWRG
ncbi:MAG: ABC transporter permease subunit [Anaerolineae bacterium]|nr:ABC transporter permease subunit [Anaerolineae bacterium]